MDYLEFKTLRHADDELMHYKYVRRERLPDGSYRYYYPSAKESLRLAAQSDFDARVQAERNNKLGTAALNKLANSAGINYRFRPNATKVQNTEMHNAKQDPKVQRYLKVKRAIAKAKTWLKNLFTKQSAPTPFSKAKAASAARVGKTFLARRAFK